MIDRIALRAGGEARVVDANAEHVTLECPAPSPPGSTLPLELAGAPLGVKVRGCKKTPAGEFRVEGRWVGLSRAQREALFGAGVNTTPSVSPPKTPE